MDLETLDKIINLLKLFTAKVCICTVQCCDVYTAQTLTCWGSVAWLMEQRSRTATRTRWSSGQRSWWPGFHSKLLAWDLGFTVCWWPGASTKTWLIGRHRWLCDYILSPCGVSVCVRFVTLSPGDVFLTGTPPGVGVFRNPPVFLKVILILQPCCPGGIPERGFSKILSWLSLKWGKIWVFRSRKRTQTQTVGQCPW